MDPSQLYGIWGGAHSHYKQPWRAWLETVPGVRFLDGLGINYQVPKNHDTIIGLLARHGFRRIRVEMGGGHLDWDMQIQSTRRQYFDDIFTACAEHRVRPLILLNNHQGVPCPVKWLFRKVASDAEQGDRTVELDSVDDIVPGRTGISNLTGYWAAEAMITSCNPATNTVTLGKPLPIALPAGRSVTLHTLKWLPLSEVGTPEFEETATYWVQYADTMCEFVASHGLSFDVEIWNELTFGSRFLDIDNYYDPPLVGPSPNSPRRTGGRCWELARRAISHVKQKWPTTKCVWGFSNTNYFHTAVSTLPRGTDAQSYHPYATAPRNFPQDEYVPDQPWRNLEGYVPHYRRIMPEGIGHDLTQCESIMWLVNPVARQASPPGTVSFEHWFTEHGWAPVYSGITDERRAAELKARMVLRASLLYLNKGISKIYFYPAYEEDPLGGGLLDRRALELAPRRWPRRQRAASPALRALRNVTYVFARSRPLHGVRSLDVDVAKLSEPVAAFPGDATHEPLWHREVFAVLPYQTRDNEFVIAMYVMTRDFTVPMAPEAYRVTFHNIRGTGASIRYYDPILGRPALA
ncbi:MAG: hypothetical protein ACE5JM_15765, partial [Armatimonadota bacterium]